MDLRGGISVLLEVDLPADVPVTPQELQDAKHILQNPSNALGAYEVTYQTSGTRWVVGEFPGLTQTDQVVAALKQAGNWLLCPREETIMLPQHKWMWITALMLQLKPAAELRQQSPRAEMPEGSNTDYIAWS